MVTFWRARKWPNICQVKSLPYQLYNIIKSSLTFPLPAPFQKCTYSPGRHKIHATFLLNFDLRSFLDVNVNSSLRYCKNFVESILQYRVLRYEYFRQCPRNHLFLFIFPQNVRFISLKNSLPSLLANVSEKTGNHNTNFVDSLSGNDDFTYTLFQGHNRYHASRHAWHVWLLTGNVKYWRVVQKVLDKVTQDHLETGLTT